MAPSGGASDHLHIWRELGLQGYSDDFHGFGGPAVIDPTNIEDVPKEVQGSIDTRRIVEAAAVLEVKPCSIAADILGSDVGFLQHVKVDVESLKQETPREIRGNMFPCFMAVLAMGIVYEIDASTIIGCMATFFCVAKSNGLLRIIFDCRPLNRCCATPIPVGLATMSEILEKASTLGINGIISGDFRAYFFELKLPGSVGLLFGFLFRGRKFLSRLFAMGFSWSPAVSQGVSWIICLHGTDKNKSLGVNIKEVRSWVSFQPFLNLYDKKGRQVGFVTIVYDNIGVFTNDPRLQQRWLAHLKRNASWFGAVWKEIYVATPEDCFDDTDEDDGPRPPQENTLLRFPKPRPTHQGRPKRHVSFLGVEFDLPRGGDRLRWRHKEKKLSTWCSAMHPPSTPRDVARITGILVWDVMLQLLPLSSIQVYLEALKEIAPTITSRGKWDEPLRVDLPVGFSEQELEVLRTRLASNPWRAITKLAPTKRYLLASDATETSIAGVLLDENGKYVDHFAKLDLPKAHIYLYECLAIFATYNWIMKKHTPQCPMEFRIAVDNRAAAAAAKRCYSSNCEVGKMFNRMFFNMEDNNITLTPIDIDTKLNIADCPTRRLRMRKDLCRMTVEVLKGTRAGRPEGPNPNKQQPSEYLPGIQEATVLDLIKGQTKELCEIMKEFGLFEPLEDGKRDREE